MRRRFTLPLLLLGLLTLPVAADPRPDILYTTRKEFVRVGSPRQLTLNAHIDKFAYDPLGLEVACTGSETQGDQTTYFVKTLDVRTGKELHRLTMTLPQDASAQFNLLGWTPSGKYLLLERAQPKEDGSSASVTDLLRWDLSADPPKVRTVEAAFPVPEGVSIGTVSHSSSPHNRRVLLGGDYVINNKLHTDYLLYDPEQDSFPPLPRPDGIKIIASWEDESHIDVRLGPDHKPQQMDVLTGKISSVPQPTADDPAVSKQYPDLTLQTEPRRQIDGQSGGGFESRIVWVRCLPRLRQPLSTVGAGLTMTEEYPQAVWSPTGKQIAFLNKGDLCVTEVSLVPASESIASEKYAIGLPLTCPEERELAVSNLKQIGLGLIQYTQDADEMFPPAEGVDEAINPYIKSRSVFSVGTVHWVYHAPEKLDLASMDAPAEYVMGTIDLPCGQVVLYGDGHVKEMPKAAP